MFFDRHADAVLGYFARRTADAQTAADLTAETFAEAFASRRRFRDVGAPAAAWLFGIARHQFSGWVRRAAAESRARSRLGLPRIQLDDEEIERIEELADLRRVQTALTSALSQLPPDLAEAVSLRIAQELPYSDVALRLGCSEAAARVRVSRGIGRLADLMAPRPEETP